MAGVLEILHVVYTIQYIRYLQSMVIITLDSFDTTGKCIKLICGCFTVWCL